MYVKKGWYGLPVVLLLLLFTVVVSCNRDTTKQTKTKQVPLSAQELLKQKNKAVRDSANIANAEKYWHLNPNNTWVQERARSMGSGTIRFKETTKITPEELFTIHKGHLGYQADDTFVETGRLQQRNGYELQYERFYKNALVIAENVSIWTDKEGNVISLRSNFKKDVDLLYETPKITEAQAKEIMIKALREKLNNLPDSLLDIWQTEWKDENFFNFALQLPSTDRKVDEMHYFATLHSPRSIEAVIYRCYVSAMTGEIIRMDPRSENINRSDITSICTDYYGDQDLDLALWDGMEEIPRYTLYTLSKQTETKSFQKWNGPVFITNSDYPTGPNCMSDCDTPISNYCVASKDLASMQWAINKAFDYFNSAPVFQQGFYHTDASAANFANMLNTKIIANTPTPIDIGGDLIPLPAPHAQFVGTGSSGYIVITGKSTESRQLFGEDNIYWNDISSLDIIGHEYTHAYLGYPKFSKFSMNGAGTNEVGNCFDEAICDIWGGLIEKETMGNKEEVWMMFDDKITNSKVLKRSSKDPNSYGYHDITTNAIGQPDYYKQTPYWDIDFDDDKYINTGIFNHWFYLLVNGGENESILHILNNSDMNSYAAEGAVESTKRVSGLGFESAKKIIHKTRYNLRSDPKLYDIVKNSIDVACDLFLGNKDDYSDVSNCKNEIIQVIRAWRAVGIELEFDGNVTFPTCITCRTGCDGDGYINGDLETGIDCDKDPNSSLPDCSCSDIPIDLDLYQYKVTPQLEACEGNIVGGSIEILPQYSRENCPVDIYIDQVYQDDVSNNGLFGGLSGGTYLVGLADGNNPNISTSFHVTVPKKEIWQTASPIISTTNHPTGSITVNVASDELLEFSWNFPGGNPFVDETTFSNTIDVASAGNYSVTVKFAGTDCIYGTYTATVGTNSGGSPICQIDEQQVFLRAMPTVFNDQTTIEIELQEQPLQVNLSAQNVFGTASQSLVNGQVLGVGTHQVTFDGSADPNGLYIFQLALVVPQCRSAVPETISIKGFKY